MRTLKEIDSDIAKLKSERKEAEKEILENQLLALRQFVPDVEWNELDVDGHTMTHLPFSFHLGLVPSTVSSIRRNEEGKIEFKVEKHCGTIWLTSSAIDYENDDC